jgi:hypothetical protein
MTGNVTDLRRINGTPVTVLEYLVGHLLPRPIGSGVLEQNLNGTPVAPILIRPDTMAKSALPLFLLKIQYLLVQNLRTSPYSPPRCLVYFFRGAIH